MVEKKGCGFCTKKRRGDGRKKCFVGGGLCVFCRGLLEMEVAGGKRGWRGLNSLTFVWDGVAHPIISIFQKNVQREEGEK